MKIAERIRVHYRLWGLFLASILAFTASPTSAEPVQLLKDINPGTTGSFVSLVTGSSPSAAVNRTYFFLADDGVHGGELWKSDGTPGGTTMVKDIWPGINSSLPNNPTNVNGTLYFVANDGLSGVELWKSDGTAAGTVRVKDIIPGTGSGIVLGFDTQLIDFNGTLVFAATDGLNGVELWKSDGTPEGTTMIKDIWPGPNKSFGRGLIVVNDILFF